MVSWVAKSWLGAWGDIFSSKYLLVCVGWGELRFKHKTESETDILYAFLWVSAWSGIHLKQALLAALPLLQQDKSERAWEQPIDWKHSKTLDVDSGWVYWRASSNYVFHVSKKPQFSSLLLVPMLWNVACDDAGKGMNFLDGVGWDVNGWDSHLRNFPRSLWYPRQVLWLPYLIFIICEIRQILFVFQISPILITGKASWATDGTQRHLRSIFWLCHCTSVPFHHIHSRAVKKWINLLNLMLKKPSRFPFCWLSPH